MQREIILTGDGSSSIAIPSMQVTYHSTHGAIQESMHVFIEAGLKGFLKTLPSSISILEMGFGTGLNALLTLVETENFHIHTEYTTLEKFPLTLEEAVSLNYCDQLQRQDVQPIFNLMHISEWEKDIYLRPNFILHKTKNGPGNYRASKKFDMVYYDAFAPTVQPELWTQSVFENIFSLLNDDGVLTTYCSKGDVRRAMTAAGFNVKKIPGPKGKREMVVATRLTRI